MKRAVFAAAGVASLLHIFVTAQQVGPNVNVLAGIDPRTGDAFLQRQNEAVVAFSTRNADHLIVAMNDYRTVDIAFDPTVEEGPNGFIARLFGPRAAKRVETVRAQSPPEAWIGLAFSRDRGATWYNALLPGYPQDPTAVGKSSPVYGDSAGSDPVLVTGQNGRVYLIALTFDRGGMSRISATRYTDRNNVEGGEPFYYDFTRQIDRGSQSSKGRFADKPSGAAYAGDGGGVFSTSGVSKKKKHVVVVPGCERVYTAYTVFEGTDAQGNFRNSVYTAVSASCGESWSNPVKVSGPYSAGGTNYPGTRNQGTATAVDPDTGFVYVAWRTYEPDGFVYVRSTDGGLTWSAPKAIVQGSVYPYDQPLLTTADGQNVVTFRSNAYPSLLVYDGALVAAWQERVNYTTGAPSPAGEPRIVVLRGTADTAGNVAWGARAAADLGDAGVEPGVRCELAIPEGSAAPVNECRPAGAQLMPHLAARDGQIAVAYYESRHQNPDPILDPGGAPRGLAPTTGYISGLQRQVDARAALLDPTNLTRQTSFQISRYPIDPLTGRVMEHASPAHPLLKRKVNYANFAMFRGGIASFIGDYLHGVPIRGESANPGFRFVFTSNETVIPPPDLDFTKYNKPQTGTVGPCNPGSRNSTIMTAEVGTGLVLGSPGTFKQLLDSNDRPLQRAFAVYVENHTAAVRGFRLTFENPAAGVIPSFDQFSIVPTVDIEVLAGSSVTRTVFLSGTNVTGSVTVRATEIPLPDLDPDQNRNPAPVLVPTLTATLTLNSDPTNPFVGGLDGNPGLGNTETHTPQLGTPQLGTPQLGTPQLGTPQLGTPQLGTPQLSTPQLGTAGEGDPTFTDIIMDVTNAGNTASGFNSLVALTTAPHLATTGHGFQVFVYRVNQSATVSGCGIGIGQQDRIIYATPQLGTPQLGTPQLGTPQLGTPQLGTPQLGTPQLGTPQLGTPQLSTASFSIAPGDPTPHDHDGTEHQHQEDDRVRLALRVIHPPGENIALAHPNPETEFLGNFAVAVAAQAADTGEEEPTVEEYDPSGVLDAETLIVTNTNDSEAGSLRAAILAANEDPDLDLITFAIPGEGTRTIALGSPLPEITAPVNIDGRSQPGYAGTPLVELDGSEAGGNGLSIGPTGANSVIRGLAISNFAGQGLSILGGSGNVIQANHVGAPDDDSGGNSGNGILIVDSPDNTIGGAGASLGNVVSGNGGEGIRIDGVASAGNVIRGNFVGISASGLTDVGNGASGVYLRRAPANFVIGNVIGGNDGFAGVAICGNPSFCGGGEDTGTSGAADGNVVQGNRIGTNADGSAAIPNTGYGVSIDGASNTIVGGIGVGEGNVISNNSIGVIVFNPPAIGSQIRGNRIASNVGLGIDLRSADDAAGVTPNDPGDTDGGSNELQNFPMLTSAQSEAGTLTVSGSLNSTPNTTFTVDVYGSATCDGSGQGEGDLRIGSVTVVTDANGNGVFTAAFAGGPPDGTVITGTATGPAGNTSEFSPCVVAGAGAGGALSFDGEDDVVNVPHSASLSLSTFTIEAWVYIDGPAFSRRPLVSKGPNLGNYTLAILGAGTQAEPGTVEYSQVMDEGNYSCGGGPITFGQWTHVAATLSGSTVVVYVNGQPVRTCTNAPAPIQNASPVLLGRATFGGEPPAQTHAGLLEEVRIWNVARSASQISGSYNQFVLPVTAGLVGYWKFDEAEAVQGILDASSSGNNGTRGAGAAAASDDPTRVVSTAPIGPIIP